LSFPERIYAGICFLAVLISIPALVSAEGVFFRSDHVVFLDGTKTPSLHVTMYIPYNQLSFSIADTVYEAEVDISVILYQKGNQKGGEIWRKKVVLADFEKTSEHKQGISWTLQVPIEPGTYDMQVTVKDVQTGMGAKREEKVIVDDASGNRVWISSPAFFFNTDGKTGGLLIAGNLDVEYDSINLLVQIAVDSVHPESLLFTYYAVNDKKERTVLMNRYIHIDSTLQWNSFPFKSSELDEEEYSITVELSEDARIVARNSKLVNIIYPFYKSKLFLERVEQMVYIASGKEMKKLEEAPIESREAVWKEFWSKKDPIPDTPENETSDEYFRRVDYANEHFRTYTSGWRTDRGRIYIIFGQPDEIEYHPFEEESVPYQIWYYYSIGKRFIFADLSMTGDYTQVRERDYDIIKK
jgi:GWxTD domain-containing protein